MALRAAGGRPKHFAARPVGDTRSFIRFFAALGENLPPKTGFVRKPLSAEMIAGAWRYGPLLFNIPETELGWPKFSKTFATAV
jgi:hypothetical protein